MGGGGGGHGHGHHEPYKIPDYRIYKVSDIPELVAIENALAAKGLKDPWLRNEVWRYSRKEFGTERARLRALIFRGFKLGFGAFVLTTVGTAIYDKMYPSDHGNGHGGESDHGNGHGGESDHGNGNGGESDHVNGQGGESGQGGKSVLGKSRCEDR